jgi:D-alanyl-D-alanine carboxypeptidase (penicillin-binding protein 5/6)
MIRSLALTSLFILSQLVQGATIMPAAPQVAASAYLLVDALSGAVLVEHNADEQLPPASLTKLMTSYVLAHELGQGRISNDDMVLISESAWAQNPVFAGSSLMWIEAGTQVKLSDLHRGVVISSGNDATVAIAEHLAGSEDAFADMMNGHAAALGMRGSHFVNSHGLPHPEHYTTARDLALLANALINNFPEEYALYSERDFTYNDIKQFNRNTLMFDDPTVDGLKTGYTSEAGYCLVSSAKREGMRLISVVLGTSSSAARKNESRKLLNYGFRFFETSEIYQAGDELTTTRVWKGQSDQLVLGVAEQVHLTLPRGRSEELETVLEVDRNLVAPIAVGAAHGTLSIRLDGEELHKAPLVALQAVSEAGFFARLWDGIVMWFTSFFSDLSSE